MNDFRIEKDIPVVKDGRGLRKYPFRDMEVGDSFAFGLQNYSGVRVAASAYGQRNAKKFVVSKIAFRCWRIE